MEYRWKIQALTPEQEAIVAQEAAALRITDKEAALLVRRGLLTAEDARQFIRPALAMLHDPFLMKDMDKAVARIDQALQRGERIMIYGDYDVDGTTAVSLTYSFFSGFTEKIDYYIPDRFKEGYGISFQGIDVAEEKGCTLMIALDCGIKAVDKVEYARQKGIDVIICDHHEQGEQLPKAVAVLDAKRRDNTYPYDELSGCGVGFKLVQAYAIKHHLPETRYHYLLSLCALSIASDIVPITGENRILAYYGLKVLNTHPTIGMSAILHIAGLEGKEITISDLGFKVGPRINACGRMKSGIEAVRLLLTDDAAYAEQLALAINRYNTERREYDTTTTQEALAMLAQDPDNASKHTTVVYSPSWYKGVIGIAASRLTETYYRPTIVFTAAEGGLICGSARSVSDFNIYEAIDSCRDLLTNFGGHLYAAGLSMKEENLAAFKERFEQYVTAHITVEQQMPCISIEDEISLAQITPHFFSVLKHLEPYGPGNPRPVFMTRHLINNRYTRRVGEMGKHLKSDLTDRTAAIGGIAFGKGDIALYIQNGNEVDACYELEENTFNGRTAIEMRIVDIIPSK